MKLWIKYIIGILLGIAAAIILPSSSPAFSSMISTLSEFAIHFGRYTLLPVLFFGTAASFYQLRDARLLHKTALWTVIVIVGSTLLLAAVGIIVTLFIKLPRIPITGEKMTSFPAMDIKTMFMQLFPYSGFDALKEGSYLLPPFILAGLLGGACASDKVASKAMINFIDSASTIFYSIMTFFIDWFSVAMIAISCYWTITAKNVLFSSTFIYLFIMLFVILLIIAGGIYPLITHIVCHSMRPYKILYAGICPLLTSFWTGDSNISLQVNIRHGRESLGIQSRTTGFVYPLFSIFARGGSALVTAICFVAILRSYSSLGFTLSDVFWIFGVTIALSFALSPLPSGGTFIALSVMCTMYGRGFEAGFLLLKPAAPIFCSFAAAFDAITAIFGSYIISVKTKTHEHVDLRHYI